MKELRTAKRDEALSDMRNGVANGSLLIRQMTPDERALNAPRPRSAPKKRR